MSRYLNGVFISVVLFVASALSMEYADAHGHGPTGHAAATPAPAAATTSPYRSPDQKPHYDPPPYEYAPCQTDANGTLYCRVRLIQ